MPRLIRTAYKKAWRMENPPSPTALRPNKQALGMAYTAARSKHPLTMAGTQRARLRLRLCVNGTLDVLAGGIQARHQIIKVTTLRLKKANRVVDKSSRGG